jgi:hypothetical protein
MRPGLELRVADRGRIGTLYAKERVKWLMIP